MMFGGFLFYAISFNALYSGSAYSPAEQHQPFQGKAKGFLDFGRWGDPLPTPASWRLKTSEGPGEPGLLCMRALLHGRLRLPDQLRFIHGQIAGAPIKDENTGSYQG
jgi:hypothetical protein